MFFYFINLKNSPHLQGILCLNFFTNQFSLAIISPLVQFLNPIIHFLLCLPTYRNQFQPAINAFQSTIFALSILCATFYIGGFPSLVVFLALLILYFILSVHPVFLPLESLDPIISLIHHCSSFRLMRYKIHTRYIFTSRTISFY